ncbi:chondroadherin-like protein [Diaphorina citri]|uniref:Chondroadherin-like protein n=1 Tax=Diaphorina citri TaxID=121845 RepID=A0A3Q0J2X8_DIACI|nr:chondroadherin-like protein [Diaphorina citri]
MRSLLVTTALLLLVHQASAFCPPDCDCNDETLVVTCKEANLDVIPLTLNPSIQRLVLKYNRIKTVDSAIQFYLSLQHVDLSHNHLVNIPIGGFEPQEKLVELQLNHNKLSSVNNKTFIGLKSLKVLNLRGNFLEDLPGRLFAPLSHLEELDLGQNRISRHKFGQVKKIIGVDNNKTETTSSDFDKIKQLVLTNQNLKEFLSDAEDKFKTNIDVRESEMKLLASDLKQLSEKVKF